MAAACLPPALSPVRARLANPDKPPAGPEEVIEVYAATPPGSPKHENVYGLLILPRDAAYDVISRLEDAPASINAIDRRIAGQVRWVLDLDYRSDADRPEEWVHDLIVLMTRLPEEEQRRLGRIYPAYTVAVAIGTGPGGLEALRRWHESLPADEPDTAAG